MHRSLISKCSSLKSIQLVIKLLISAIVSFKNSRFDGLEIPTVNEIGNILGGFKLQISPKTDHADVLLLLNRGSPSMFKDSINLLLRLKFLFDDIFLTYPKSLAHEMKVIHIRYSLQISVPWCFK